MKQSLIIIFSILLIALASCSNPKDKNKSTAHKNSHSFEIDSVNFLLDGKPFQIISGEMHYARIPKKYWRHRIKMAKAMGCNTIATYLFWNYHEYEKGKFDFESENRNIAEFIKIVKEEGMWLLLRPGPYVCGEWDLGGLPPYLLSIPDIKLRCTDKRYMSAVKKYVTRIAQEVNPYLITNGGPIIMLQIENEYGSFGNDREYLKQLKNLWIENGIDIPFYTADGPTAHMLEAGSLPGVAVGLDAGRNQGNIDFARKMNPGVPVFSSETYPGWLTHWNGRWQKPDTANLLKQVRFLMDNKLSVNFYVLHGGTNFGFSAGANYSPNGYVADVTSYDYDAPVNEQGTATYKYYALRNILKKYSPNKLEPMPNPIPVMEIPEIKMTKYSTVWENLSTPIKSVQPKPFEYYKHYYGFALYKTKLIGRKKGKLTITELHDYATVFLDGKYIGTVTRTKGAYSIYLPESESKNPVLEIFVEGMGRINFGEHLTDRKGITERVSLNGMTLMNWEVYCLPMTTDYISNLKKTEKTEKQGVFFKGEFMLNKVADTYIDMTNYQKGVVWVNEHNLGRYWSVGPQHSLYCPAPFLNPGKNKIIIFDLQQLKALPVKGIKELL